MENLITNGIPPDFFNLEIIVKMDPVTNKPLFYSCNNRRLCFLKNLLRLGFQGDINGTAILRCLHNTEPRSSDPFVQMGNRPGNYCSKLI